MNRRIIAGVVTALIIGSVGAYLLVFPLGTSFHYQKVTTADNAVYLVGVKNIRECEVTVSFTNDSSLLYSIDIEMYGLASSTVFYIYEDEVSTLINFYDGPSRTDWSGEEVRVKKLDIVLGTGKAYNVQIWGTNLTTTVTYSNGALIGQDSYVRYRADNGTMTFSYDGSAVDDETLGDPLTPTRLTADLGREAYTGYQLAYVEVDVDLPYFYYGDADFITETLDVTYSGWTRGPIPEVESYFTDDVEGEGFPPRLYLDIFSSEIVADLMKAITP
ncbi:MAG: hypothetical protein ACW96M_04290 [Candidatus Thorarchaeota archaeon]|jgi:hypothetical protein